MFMGQKVHGVDSNDSIFIPLSMTMSCQVPCGFSPQHRTVENVQSTKPSEDLRK